MIAERRTILITAGPTREYIDPVRFISNESSGHLGACLARIAKKMGYRVILLTSISEHLLLEGVETRSFVSAQDLFKAMKELVPVADVLFMTAAVSDYGPKKRVKGKIKRGNRGDFSLSLRENPDILGFFGSGRRKGSKLFVGFCIETTSLIKYNKLSASCPSSLKIWERSLQT